MANWYNNILLPWTECADLNIAGDETWVHSLCVTSNGYLVALVKSNTVNQWTVCRSLDDGNTWQDHYDISTTYMESLAGDGGTILAYGTKITYSTDHGATWSVAATPVGHIKTAIKANDGYWYIGLYGTPGQAQGIYRSTNLTSWAQAGTWSNPSYYRTLGLLVADIPNNKLYCAGGENLSGSITDPIWVSTSPYTTWTKHTADFDEEVRAMCYHNGSLYMVGYTGSLIVPVVWKLIADVWTFLSYPPSENYHSAYEIFSLNNEFLIISGGASSASHYGKTCTWISKDDGVTWYSVGMDYLEAWNVYTTNWLKHNVAYNPNTKTLFLGQEMGGEGRVWKADMASFEVPWVPTGLSATPIGGGIVIDADTPFDDGFDSNLDNYTIIKKVGTESATLQTNANYIDKYLLLDLPDSADTDVTVVSNMAIPNGINWELDVDIIEYTPDDSTTNGFFFSFGIKDVSGDNVISVTSKKQGANYVVRMYHKYNGGAGINDSDLYSNANPSQVVTFKLKRFGNTLSVYAFLCFKDTYGLYTYKWQSVGAVGFLPYAGNMLYLYFEAYDNTNRGGSVCFNNLRYRQTNSIYYDTSSGLTTLTGTKLDQKRLPYIHTANDKNYYIATSENKLREGLPCNEIESIPLPGLSLGTIDQFNSSETRYTRICIINNTQLAIVYLDNVPIDIKCAIYTFDDTTLGLSLVANSQIIIGDVERGPTVCICCCTVDINKWILVYRAAASDLLKIHLLSWNGSVITNHGNKLSTSVLNPTYFSCGLLEINKFWVTWSRTDEDDLEGIIGTVSGTSISFGSVQNIDISDQEDWLTSCTVNPSTIFSIFYSNVYVQDQYKGQRHTVTGTNISSGSQTPSRDFTEFYDDLYDHQYTHCCSPDRVRVIVARQLSDPYVGDEIIGILQIASNISSTINWGREYIFSNDKIANIRIIPLGSNHIIICYENMTQGYGEIQALQIDWANDTFVPYLIGIFETGSAGGGGDLSLDMKRIGDRTIAIAYQDDDDNDYGKARLLKFYVPNDKPPTPLNPSATKQITDIRVAWDANFENEYFSDLDNFYFTKLNGTETATIVSEKMHLDIPDGVDAAITSEYTQHDIPAGDFSFVIELSNYTPDNAEGFRIAIVGSDSEGVSIDIFKIWYRSTAASTAHLVRSSFIANGAETLSSTEYPITIPSKIRIERVGNILYTSYFSLGVWSTNGTQDFGSRAANITKLKIFSEDYALHGGSVDIDNLKSAGGTDSYNIYWSDSPGVTVLNGTKISGVTNPYDHTTPLQGILYYYIITAENEFLESDPTAEISELSPSLFVAYAEAGDSENIITFYEVPGVIKYDIFWSNSPTLTILNGTKIENVENGYHHINLTRQMYYYIVVAYDVLQDFVSLIVSAKPDFEGKIFDHCDQIKSTLLYQYMDKD